jgi:hypothetical protein
MSTLFERAAWPACTSAFQLDRLALGELVAEEADALRDHIDGCARCAAAEETLARHRAASLPPLRLPVTSKPPTLKLVPAPEEAAPIIAPQPRRRPAPPPPVRRSWAARAVATFGLLAAAGVAFVVSRPAPDGERTKGPQVELAMFVQHAEQVRRALPGEVVAAGDAVRFALTSPSGGFGAVLSLDPRGRAFVYYPISSKAAELQAGREVALPLGTRLDDSVGTERLLGLVCTTAVELEPVRAALEAGQGVVLPPGCEGSQWSFVKR